MFAGWKTYIVAFVTALYAVAQYLAGNMDVNHASELALGAAGLGALRSGLTTQFIGLAEMLLPMVLRALNDATQAAKKTAPAVLVCLLLGVTLAACSSDQTAKVSGMASSLEATIAAAKPIVNAAACDAQSAANVATDALISTHNAGDAATAASASKLLGLLCFTTKAPDALPPG